MFQQLVPPNSCSQENTLPVSKTKCFPQRLSSNALRIFLFRRDEDLSKMKSPTTPKPEEDPTWTRFRKFDVNKETQVNGSPSEPSTEANLMRIDLLESMPDDKNTQDVEVCLECGTKKENTPFVLKIESKITLDSNMFKVEPLKISTTENATGKA